MGKTRFIGDVHGKYEPYKRLIKGCQGSIQVGDMGVGFRRTQGYRAGEVYSNPPHMHMFAGNHRFIRGNHDNPGECAKHSQWIKDGHIEDGIMFVGGATSVDKHMRVEGHSWWADEELSYEKLMELVELYCDTKPEVMVTHDCPEEVAAELARVSMSVEKLDQQWRSRSREAFQQMWQMRPPKLWVFGHWHHSFDHVLGGTRFICLAELEARDIDLTSLEVSAPMR